MPEVSIIVPVYNVAAYLPKCIDSLLQQTFADFELWLVNDGSTDGSLSICEAYQKKDARIHLINQKNAGLSQARNAGLQKAQGAYVGFVDSDDFVEPTLLEKTIAKARQFHADMVLFDVYQYYQATNTKERIQSSFSDQQVYQLKTCPSLMIGILNAAWNKLYKRKLFTDNHITFPKGKLYEDLGTTYRLLARAQAIAFVKEPLYDYLKDRPGNITSRFDERSYDILPMLEITIDDYKINNWFPLYYEELKYLAAVNIMECLKKTRDVKDKQLVNAYIDACFAFIKKYFPDFPKGKYNIVREKYDDIYSNPRKLKLYLAYRRMTEKLR